MLPAAVSINEVRLAAVLFCDVVGSTEERVRLGDAQADERRSPVRRARLRRRRRDRGRIVKGARRRRDGGVRRAFVSGRRRRSRSNSAAQPPGARRSRRLARPEGRHLDGRGHDRDGRRPVRNGSRRSRQALRGAAAGPSAGRCDGRAARRAGAAPASNRSRRSQRRASPSPSRRSRSSGTGPTASTACRAPTAAGVEHEAGVPVRRAADGVAAARTGVGRRPRRRPQHRARARRARRGQDAPRRRSSRVKSRPTAGSCSSARAAKTAGRRSVRSSTRSSICSRTRPTSTSTKPATAARAHEHAARGARIRRRARSATVGHDPRATFFVGIGDLLVDAGRSAPVLFVLDDLQWARRPTLQLVGALAPLAVARSGSAFSRRIGTRRPTPTTRSPTRSPSCTASKAPRASTCAGSTTPACARSSKLAAGADLDARARAGGRGSSRGRPTAIPSSSANCGTTSSISARSVPDGRRLARRIADLDALTTARRASGLSSAAASTACPPTRARVARSRGSRGFAVRGRSARGRDELRAPCASSNSSSPRSRRGTVEPVGRGDLPVRATNSSRARSTSGSRRRARRLRTSRSRTRSSATVSPTGAFPIWRDTRSPRSRSSTCATAVAVTTRAADAAMRAYAYEDAVELLTSVLPFVGRRRRSRRVVAAHRQGRDPRRRDRAVARALAHRDRTRSVGGALRPRAPRRARRSRRADWRLGLPGDEAERLLREAMPYAADEPTRFRALAARGRALALSGDPAAENVIEQAIREARAHGDDRCCSSRSSRGSTSASTREVPVDARTGCRAARAVGPELDDIANAHARRALADHSH